MTYSDCRRGRRWNILVVTVSMAIVRVAAVHAAESPCGDPAIASTRRIDGEWDSDSARNIADATQTEDLSTRRRTIEAARSCLASDVSTVLQKTRGRYADLENADKRHVNAMTSISASLKLLEDDVDLYDLHVETFAAVMYSNLFRDKATDGFFSKSRPYLDFEFRQIATGDRALEAFGDIGFKGTASVTESNAAETIQQSNDFFADAGVLFFPNLLTATPTRRGNIGVGIVGSAGFVGAPTAGTDSAGSESTSVNDSFSPTYKGGVVVRQLSGHWIGSFTEFAYLRDPRFDHRDRAFVRGRLRFGRENSDDQGHGLSSFLEGSVNLGKGKDEARIIIGVGLDTEKILKAVLGLGSTQKQQGTTTETAR